MFVVNVAWRGERHAFADGEAVCLQLCDLVRIVGDQPQLPNTKLFQHTACRHEVALVHLKAKRMVGINRVETIILKRIGPHLVEKADIPPFLRKIEQDTPASLGHHRQGCLKLISTIAFQAAKNIAGDAL